MKNLMPHKQTSQKKMISAIRLDTINKNKVLIDLAVCLGLPENELSSSKDSVCVTWEKNGVDIEAQIDLIINKILNLGYRKNILWTITDQIDDEILGELFEYNIVGCIYSSNTTYIKEINSKKNNYGLIKITLCQVCFEDPLKNINQISFLRQNI